MKLAAVLVAALVACDAVSGASAATAKPKAAKSAKDALFKKVQEDIAALTHTMKAKAARGLAAGHGAKKAANWTGDGIAKRLMDYDTLTSTEEVADTYPGITYERAYVIRQENLDAIGWYSNPPSLPSVWLPDFFTLYGFNSYASMNGLFVGGISFYYATNAEYEAAFLRDLNFQYAKVVAFSGPDGEGKPLGEVQLKWRVFRTKGANLTFAFEKEKLVWKGVAKSIAFYVPTIESAPIPLMVFFDNIKAIAPSGELATKVAAKLADAEAEVAAKADAVKGLLNKLDAKLPDVELPPLKPLMKKGE